MGEECRSIDVDIDRWLDLTKTPPHVREEIHALLRQELEGSTSTGMRPFLDGGALKFRQTWAVVVGSRRASP